ncbi:RNA polymerase sigma-70 factor [Chroogloeocystis siderophila]|nr:RNA polymerase sigma-70 factor [Chroogloeocystis siderophila]
MKTLLRIDASVRVDGSNTRILTDYFQSKWLSANPGSSVIQRCLSSNPVPHICNETIEAFQHSSGTSNGSTLSDTLIDELKKADHLLIGSPLYNFTLPSTLKAYFDHVVRSGFTFGVRQGTYRGLLNGKGATVITARGGKSSLEYEDDFQTAYFRAILSFIGINSVDVIALEGTALGQESKEKALSYGKQQVDWLFDRTDVLVWQGEFTEKDKQQIEYLRAGQADAITKGDADAYVGLCTDDIHLLIPSHEVVSGCAAFLNAEKALFSTMKFAHFQKFPFHIERSGNLAFEMGRQKVIMHKHDSRSNGVFSTYQKYTHIFRLTSQGWRFAVLMSKMTDERTLIFEQNRQTLEGIAYRMLGDLSDARDVVQETYLKWREVDFSSLHSPRAWLITVCSRTALNQLQSARTRRELYVGTWLPEPYLDKLSQDPSAQVELDDTVSVALLLALERLSPPERAAFLLHDVFDLSFGEIASILGKSNASCRQLATRARRRVQEQRPRFHTTPEEHHKLLYAFISAARQGDLEQLMAVLSNNVELYSDGGGKVEALFDILQGANQVARFFISIFDRYHQRNIAVQTLMLRFNGVPGILIYENGQLATALTIDVYAEQIHHLYAIRNPDKLSDFPAKS